MKKEWIKYSFRKYNKTYPKWFNQEKKQLFRILGKKVKIEHIGSTAIPGLGGKGIIDIAILIPKEKYILTKKKIISLGYLQWPVPSWKKRLSFEKYPKIKKSNKIYYIHLTSDLREFKKMTFFRDYLLKNPELIREYSNLKKRAATLCKNKGQKYRDLKSPFIKSINRKINQNNSKVKAIIFDIGGVLHVGDQNSHEEVYQALNIPKKEYFKKIGLVWEKLVIGKISNEKGLFLMAKSLGVSKDRLRAIWKQGIKKRFILNKPLLALIKNLKKNYKTAILSDQWFLPYNQLITKQVSSAFDVTIFSHQIGIRKPDKKIYKKTLAKLKLDPLQCVFIDNQDWNLTPAKKLGMKAILFKNNKQLVKELKKLGVKVK